MPRLPRHAACFAGLCVLCLMLAFDLLLVRAVVIESDFQSESFCRFNPQAGDCR
jgi:hypothetical protein